MAGLFGGELFLATEEKADLSLASLLKADHWWAWGRCAARNELYCTWGRSMAAAAAVAGFKKDEVLLSITSLGSNLNVDLDLMSAHCNSGLLGVLGGVSRTDELPSLSTRK